MNACPDREELLLLVHEKLPKRDHDNLMVHLENCTACQRSLEALAAGDASWDTSVHLLKQNQAPLEPALAGVIEDLTSARARPVNQAPRPHVAGPARVEDLTFLGPGSMPDSLGRIGHYEVLQVLGRGGFGIVLRTFDDVLQRVVALKVLAPVIAATSPARKRFLREAQASAKVRHENVVQVYAVEEQPLPYLVMVPPA